MFAMFQRILLTTCAAIFFYLGGTCPAMGCACSQNSPGACAGLQKGDVVFLGTVTAIDSVPPPVTSSSDLGAVPNSGTESENSGAATAAPENVSAAPPSAPITRYHFHI